MIPGVKLIDDILRGLPENARLREQLGELRAQIEVLQTENEQLKTKLDQLAPKADQLDPKAFDILNLFFDAARDLSTEDAASHFRLHQSVAEFHTDALLERRFIQQTVMGMTSDFGTQPSMFAITPTGRKYVMQHNVA